MDRNSKRLVSAEVELSVVLPLHPRARQALVDLGFEQRLTAMSQLRVVDPLGYLDFLKLMSETRIGLTDSRGDDVRGREPGRAAAPVPRPDASACRRPLRL